MRPTIEGAAKLLVPRASVVSKKLKTFYNPTMKLNRDLTLIYLLANGKQELLIADPLAGTGVRSIRMLKELPENMLRHVCANDSKKGFQKAFEENCKQSGLAANKASASEQDANKFLLSLPSQDYIDIDPFGSPNPYLDASIKKTKRGGTLAVTATDTAPLCGTYPKACQRKYWATPRRDHLMHEYGLRILIRKCQLIGAQYDKALTPRFCYSKHHYFRAFFDVQVGKSAVDTTLKQHETIDGYGPIWTGKLYDQATVRMMAEHAHEPSTKKLLETIAEESRMDVIGFFDVHVLSKKLRRNPPRHEQLLEALKQQGFLAARTHFSPKGIRTTADEHTMTKIIEETTT